jgi:hypothetical protein
MKLRVPHPLWILSAALVLGVVAVVLQVGIEIHRQQTALAIIRRLQGSFETQQIGPDWVLDWLGDEVAEQFFTVVAFSLDGSEATDQDLDAICALTNVESATLSRTNVSDAGLERLRGLTRLRILSLDHTSITDQGLEHLTGLTNLEELSLGGTNITDVGLAQLRTLPSLQELSIWKSRITDASVSELRRSSPALRVYR